MYPTLIFHIFIGILKISYNQDPVGEASLSQPSTTVEPPPLPVGQPSQLLTPSIEVLNNFFNLQDVCE